MNRPAALHPIDAAPWLALLEERFGLPPEAFEAYVLLGPAHKYITLAARDHRPPRQPHPASTGIPFIRTKLRYPKLTTAGALLFGAQATRNVVPLTRRHAEAYTARASFRLAPAQVPDGTTTGYVIVKHGGAPLGVAFFRADEAGGLLQSLYPKAWAARG